MERPWNSDRIVAALASRFWFNNTVMTEWEIDGGRADLVVISKALYLTEIEIKVTATDWKKDGKKIKWTTPLRPHVARFFYCVPAFLVESAPPDLPEGVGILSIVTTRRGYDRVREVRKAKRLKGSKKLTEKDVAAIYKASYFRFWRHTINAHYEEARRRE